MTGAAVFDRDRLRALYQTTAVPEVRDADRELELRVMHSGLVLEDGPQILMQLGPDDWTDPTLRFAWEVSFDLQTRCELVSLDTVREEIRARGRWNQHEAVLNELALVDAFFDPRALESACETLRKRTALRTAAGATAWQQRALREGDVEAAALHAAEATQAREALDGWPAPQPITTYEVPEWPSGVLPEVLERWVQGVALNTQTPVAFPSMAALGTVALACARRWAASGGSAWTEPLCLWTCAAMPPASRKSAVMGHATAPLIAWQDRRQAEEAGDVARRRAQRQAREQYLRSLQTRAGSTMLSEAERAEATRKAGDLAAQLAQEPEPVLTTLWSDDASPERLAQMLAEQGGSMALISAEGGSVFDSLVGQYSSKPNLRVYLMGHAGDHLTVDRLNRPRIVVKRARLSMALAVQTRSLRTLAENPALAERGLIDRFLFAVPRSTVGSRSVKDYPISADALRGYRSTLEALLDVDAANDEHGHAVLRSIELSREARELLASWREKTEPRMGELGDLEPVSAWAGKLVGAVVRMAAVFHLVDAAAQGALADPGPVEALQVERAVFLAEEFLIPHARAAYGAIEVAPEVHVAERVLAWLRQHRQPIVSAREVYVGAHLERHGGMRTRDAALALLEVHGYLRRLTVSTEGTRGRPTEHWRVHPSLVTARGSA